MKGGESTSGSNTLGQKFNKQKRKSSNKSENNLKQILNNGNNDNDNEDNDNNNKEDNIGNRSCVPLFKLLFPILFPSFSFI